MYAYIRGKLSYSSPSQVTLETNGVGYQIFIPANLFTRLPQIGEESLLYTSFVVRELSQTLYGFSEAIERDFFEALLNVSGIGPKTALNLIGHMALVDLQQAISDGNIPLIVRVPGIGKKTAERLIIELRDKMAAFAPSTTSPANMHSVAGPHAQKVSDAMNALVHLGYNQVNAQKAIKKSLNDLPESINLADLITHALKHV